MMLPTEAALRGRPWTDEQPLLAGGIGCGSHPEQGTLGKRPCRRPRAQTCRTTRQVRHMRPRESSSQPHLLEILRDGVGPPGCFPLSPTHRCGGPVPLGSQVQGHARTGPPEHASGGPSARCGAPRRRTAPPTHRPSRSARTPQRLAFNPLEGLGERPGRTCPTVGQVCLVPRGVLDTPPCPGAGAACFGMAPRAHTPAQDEIPDP
jgi:hypothetical protein